LEEAFTAANQRLNELTAAQTAEFAASQTERASEAEQQTEDFATRFAKWQQGVGAKASGVQDDLARMKREAAELVGAIGASGTANHYKTVADDQRAVANVFRLVTILVGLVAAGAGVFAAFANHRDNGELVAKLAVSAVLAGVSAYTARQSAFHRKWEQRARNMQLEFQAFTPFIEPLKQKDRELERIRLSRSTFGRAGSAEAPAVDDAGPGLASSLGLPKRNGATDATA
jgi:hypothetical protein